MGIGKVLDDFSMKNSITTKYRTGVVNDFSMVEKAVFHILKCNDTAGKKLWTVKESLPVQINPDKFSYSARSQVHMVNGISTKNNCSMGVATTPIDDNNISIPLIYDIYDEYVIGTNDGASLSSISLFDENRTTLPKLVSFASEFLKSDRYVINAARALFSWGPIKYFGMLTGVSCDYKAFSRWGEPLKCDATVSMTLTPVTSDDVFTTTNMQVKSYSVASNIKNKVALGITSALR